MEKEIIIRKASAADAEALLLIYAPYVEKTAITFEYDVPCKKDFLQRFDSVTAQFPWLVWEENGQVLGYAYGSLPFTREAYAWCGEVSIYLAPEIHGRGIGRKLYAVLEEIMWRQGYRVIYSLITTENKPSLAFHEALGYRTTATFPDCGVKFGRWLGIVWMEKRSQTVELPTSPPVPWKEIVKDNQILTHILANLSLSESQEM